MGLRYVSMIGGGSEYDIYTIFIQVLYIWEVLEMCGATSLRL